jgi:hypothetical protein
LFLFFESFSSFCFFSAFRFFLPRVTSSSCFFSRLLFFFSPSSSVLPRHSLSQLSLFVVCHGSPATAVHVRPVSSVVLGQGTSTVTGSFRHRQQTRHFHLGQRRSSSLVDHYRLCLCHCCGRSPSYRERTTHQRQRHQRGRSFAWAARFPCPRSSFSPPFHTNCSFWALTKVGAPELVIFGLFGALVVCLPSTAPGSTLMLAAALL